MVPDGENVDENDITECLNCDVSHQGYEHLTDEDMTTEQRCVEDSEEHSGGTVIHSVARESHDGTDVC